MDVLGYRLVVGWPTAVGSLIVLALLALGLRNPWLRSWRTVCAALLAMVILVVAIVVPVVPHGIIRGALLAAYGLGILFENRHLWSLHSADGEFAMACRANQSRFSALAGRIGSISPADYIQEFAAITEELKRLPAPSDDWRRARDNAVDELSRRVTRMRLGVMPTNDESKAAEDRWGVIQAEFRRLFDAKRTFWLPWP